MSDRTEHEEKLREEASRENAEGEAFSDLPDAVQEELETDPLTPDPEDALEERDDTHYTDRTNET